jgi:L-fucose isomerase-like protein
VTLAMLLTFFFSGFLINPQEHAAWENAFCGALQSTKDFASASKCKIQIQNCAPETPEDVAANTEVAADNYIVSDMRSVLRDDEEGVIFTLQAVDHSVTEQFRLASE